MASIYLLSPKCYHFMFVLIWGRDEKNLKWFLYSRITERSKDSRCERNSPSTREANENIKIH